MGTIGNSAFLLYGLSFQSELCSLCGNCVSAVKHLKEPSFRAFLVKLSTCTSILSWCRPWGGAVSPPHEICIFFAYKTNLCVFLIHGPAYSKGILKLTCAALGRLKQQTLKCDHAYLWPVILFNVTNNGIIKPTLSVSTMHYGTFNPFTNATRERSSVYFTLLYKKTNKNAKHSVKLQMQLPDTKRWNMLTSRNKKRRVTKTIWRDKWGG